MNTDGQSLLKLAVTGGVASGKSTVCRMVREQVEGCVFFDCDEEARKVIEEDAIKAELVREFGEKAVNPEGGVERGWLGDLVFSDREARQKLEDLLHPPILSACRREMRESAGQKESRLFLADVPLLYEASFHEEFDFCAVVAVSGACQLSRLMQRDGVERERAEKMARSQLPLDEKAAKADAVIWNEGSHRQTERQVHLLLERLKS